MRKTVGFLALALLLLVLSGGGLAAAQTNSQRITFNFDPSDGIGWGQASGMIPPWIWAPISASFDGRLLTRANGSQDFTALTGNLTFSPGTPGEAVYTVQLKPGGSYSFTSGPWPGCTVVCHTTTVVTQMKYQGPGSSARDGAGTLNYTVVENLPVGQSTRATANFWGIVVSKDQGWNIYAWDRNTPTIE